MMIVWILLILLLLFIVFFLCASSCIHVVFDQTLSVQASLFWGLWKLEIIPSQKKKDKKTSKPKKEKEKAGSAQIIETISDALSVYEDLAISIRKHFRFETFDFYLSFGTGDAAATAVLSGLAWSVVYQVIGFVDTVFMLEEPRVGVHPDFESNSFSLYLDTTFKVNHFHALRVAVIAMIKYLRRSNVK